MRFTSLPRKALVAAALTTCFSAAHATNGYFAHGYGVKAKGMGGASVAMTEDAFAGATNPAKAAFVGNRWDIGVELFSPKRSMSRSGSNLGLDGSVESDKDYFLIPEFGYNVALSDKIGLNLSVYGNGGMNTSYPGGNFTCMDMASGQMYPGNALCGMGKLGVDMAQLIIAPTFAYKLDPNHSIGISPLLVYQRFKAYGIQPFAMMSSSPANVTDNGIDTSTGFGVRLGYYGKVNDKLSIGAAYSPKVSMEEFDKYKGLFAEGGGFDIPGNYTVGFALNVSPTTVVALDYQRILYSDVASVGNPSTNMAIAPLGAANGAGFGWKDIGVWKLGGQWQANATWTLRAGYNRSENPIQARDVTFNILAPGVMQDHLTLGATMAIDKAQEVSFFYMHAREKSVAGASALGPMFQMMGAAGADGGTETVRMHQNSIGVQYSKKF